MIYEKLFFLLQIFLLQGSFSSKNLVVAMVTISAEKNLNLYISWKREMIQIVIIIKMVYNIVMQLLNSSKLLMLRNEIQTYN